MSESVPQPLRGRMTVPCPKGVRVKRRPSDEFIGPRDGRITRLRELEEMLDEFERDYAELRENRSRFGWHWLGDDLPPIKPWRGDPPAQPAKKSDPLAPLRKMLATCRL